MDELPVYEKIEFSKHIIEMRFNPEGQRRQE